MVGVHEASEETGPATSTMLQQEEIPFPSLRWFEALAEVAALEAEHYRRLGVAEIRLGVSVGDMGFRIVFEDFGVAEVSSWDGRPPVDCVISASESDWRELVEHVREHSGADADHTLNSLVLSGRRFRLTGDEQLGVDRFYRFNATLQSFFDKAARVPTRFS